MCIKIYFCISICICIYILYIHTQYMGYSYMLYMLFKYSTYDTCSFLFAWAEASLQTMLNFVLSSRKSKSSHKPCKQSVALTRPVNIMSHLSDVAIHLLLCLICQLSRMECGWMSCAKCSMQEVSAPSHCWQALWYKWALSSFSAKCLHGRRGITFTFLLLSRDSLELLTHPKD